MGSTTRAIAEPGPRLPSFSAAVAARRDYVEQEMLDVCHRFARPRVLAIGNGTLREAEVALHLIRSKGGEFVLVDRGRGLGAIEPQPRVRRVFENELSSETLGRFHFVYGLSLLNETADRACTRILGLLSNMLQPGGRLLLTNFSPCCREPEPQLPVAFARGLPQLAALTEALHPLPLAGQMIWTDPSERIVYLEIAR